MSGKGRMIRCTPKNPCPLCGKPDWCMSIDYGDGGTVVWCGRTQNEGDVVAGGVLYDFISHKVIDNGEFNLYMQHQMHERVRAAEKAAWIEEQKRTNPNWKKKGYFSYKPPRAQERVSADSATTDPERVVLKPHSVKEQETNTVPPLSNRELDERYRFLLSLLVLEDKHRAMLLKEWQSDVYPDLGEDLLARWPLRSLPPADRVRFGEKFSEPYGKKLQNKSRKAIVQAMVDKFGDLSGVPGFYQRTGDYWEQKPSRERWTLIDTEGLLFPVFDSDGFLYRLRIRDDYHAFSLKGLQLFEDKKGTFYHNYSKDGEHLWYFRPEEGETELVYGETVYRIELDGLGRPKLGKPSGKYKTISSNGMESGSASGSPISIYYPSKDRNAKIVIFTEGEKKAMVASYIKNCPVVSFPGVGTFSQMFVKGDSGESLFETLVGRGMAAFVIAYDSDKETNKQVKKAEERCIEEVKSRNISVLKAEWNDGFDKGIDDVLLMGVDIQLRPA